MTIKLEYPEGATPLDPDEIAGLRQKHITTQGQLDELEAANITAGLRWLARTRRKDFFTEDFVLDLHRQLFGEVWAWAGSYRTTGKNIGVDANMIGQRLRFLLDDAKYWAENGTYQPPEAAVRLHHGLVFIHPFPNGNGRHARIMADAILQKLHGAEPIPWLVDRNHAAERRAAYIAALKAADDHDFGPLLAFINA